MLSFNIVLTTEFKLVGKQCYRVFNMIYSFGSVQTRANRTIPGSNSTHFFLQIYPCYVKKALEIVI
jgi:hypothetical protein